MKKKVSNVPRQLWKHEILLHTFFKRHIHKLFDEYEVIYKPYSEKANIHSFTLEEISLDKLEDGVVYTNIDGHSLQYTPNDEYKFKFITRSPLYIWMGGNMDGLTPMQLRLFWILTYNAEKGYGV